MEDELSLRDYDPGFRLINDRLPHSIQYPGSLTVASTDWWNDFRARMPVADQWAYFDHAAVAPLSGPAAAAMCRFAEDISRNGDANWHRWRREVESLRRLAASMLNASANDVAIVRNTTEGINIVAEGFPWREGDNVVTLESEFPSNLFPWMNLASQPDLRSGGAQSHRTAGAKWPTWLWLETRR